MFNLPHCAWLHSVWNVQLNNKRKRTWKNNKRKCFIEKNFNVSLRNNIILQQVVSVSVTEEVCNLHGNNSTEINTSMSFYWSRQRLFILLCLYVKKKLLWTPYLRLLKLLAIQLFNDNSPISDSTFFSLALC